MNDMQAMLSGKKVGPKKTKVVKLTPVAKGKKIEEAKDKSAATAAFQNKLKVNKAGK